MDTVVFINKANRLLFGGKMSSSQKTGILRLLDAWKKYGTGNDNAGAYVLATSFHETGQRMQPVREGFASSERGAIAALEKAFKAGRMKWVKTPYWREGFFGRGDVQLTHEGNYSGPLAAAVKREFHVDIHAEPELVLEPAVSAFIAVEGMTKGLTSRADFTKYGLEDFFTATKSDFDNARKIINPGELDSYKKVGDYARKFAECFATACVGDTSDIYDGKPHPEIEKVQTLLDEKGYPEVGAVDGRYGDRTASVIMSFRRNNGLPLSDKLDSEFLAALAMAEKRDISESRKAATIADLRSEGAKDIKQTDQTKLGGYATALLGGGLGASKALEDAQSTSSAARSIWENIEPFQTFVMDNIWLLAVGAGLFFVWKSGLLQNIRLEKHREGQDVSA
jgi:hypothetical protein